MPIVIKVDESYVRFSDDGLVETSALGGRKLFWAKSLQSWKWNERLGRLELSTFGFVVPATDEVSNAFKAELAKLVVADEVTDG